MLNPCLKCTKKREDCCESNYIKFTTLRDAERIAKFLDTTIKNVVIYSQLTKPDKQTELYLHKIHNYYYDLVSDDGKILQLRKRKDRCCPFLLKSGHCKIYEVRPLICRVFPFWYSNKGKIMIDHNGIDCGIVEGKSTSTLRIKAKHRKNIFKEFNSTTSELKKLLMKLKGEIEEYKKNIDNFICKNKVKIY